MSIATLTDLLSASSQGKWLLVATFLLFFLPVLLPLLFLLSCFALMLLLPLGCALVGFLSWHRLRKPSAAASLGTIGDETQGKLLHFLLVKSGFVHFLLSFVLVSQLARFVEWREIKGGDYEGSDEGSSLGDRQIRELSKGGVDDVVNGGSEDGRGDVFLWYNPLASIFNAERQDDDSDSSIFDVESSVSDHDFNEIKALEDCWPLEGFQEFKSEVSDTIIDGNFHDNDSNGGAALITDLEHDFNGEVLTSAERVEDRDVSERLGYISDLLIANDSDRPLSTCSGEKTLFSEIQLELKKYESMYITCNEHLDWIASLHAEVKSKDQSQMCWKDHSSKDKSCSKSANRRSNRSSISSILSTGNESSLSMMSSTMSSASSTSTWSAWSEDQSSKKNTHHKSGGKNVGPLLLGKWSGVGGAAKASPTGRGVAGGWRVGERAVEREQRNASRVGTGKVNVQSGSGPIVTAFSERDSRCRTKGSTAGRVIIAEDGSSEAATGNGSSSRSKRYGSQEEAGQGKSRGVSGRVARGEGLTGRTQKLGVKRVSAELESSGASPDQVQAQVQAQAIRNSNHFSRRGKPSPNKVASEPNYGKMARVNRQPREWPGLVSSGLHAGEQDSNGNESTAELEDVRKRIVHDNYEERTLPAGDDVNRRASETYPQLLEFWRSIEQAFARQQQQQPISPPH